MKPKFIVQLAGLLAIMLLVLGTAGYFWMHPDQRTQDVRRFGHGPRQFQPSQP